MTRFLCHEGRQKREQKKEYFDDPHTVYESYGRGCANRDVNGTSCQTGPR